MESARASPFQEQGAKLLRSDYVAFYAVVFHRDAVILLEPYLDLGYQVSRYSILGSLKPA